jgi:hypothetical protein
MAELIQLILTESSRWMNLNFKVTQTISVHKRMKMTSCIKLWHKTNSSNEYDKMKNCDDMDQIAPCEWNSHHMDDIDQMEWYHHMNED